MLVERHPTVKIGAISVSLGNSDDSTYWQLFSISCVADFEIWRKLQ